MSKLSMSMFATQADYWKARAEAAEAERDRLRDALIACRPAVLRDLDRYSMSAPTDESKRLYSLLNTIDAAAKGRG